ncbi:MAG: diaminopimelate epimerase [Candidatus Omnitrophica bacterium]|nr:diaminopimelate epimerase [Candidatus Omnitrophota bacterium]
MNSPIEFTKMAASGNDFLVLDNRGLKLRIPDSELPLLAKRLCQRRFSVGADGLLVIEESKKADYRMRIFNPDGSEVTMCGNGSRCAALYAVEKGIAKKDHRIETLAGLLEANVDGRRARVKLADPRMLRLDFEIDIGGDAHRVSYINTNVPHAVYFVDDLEGADVKGLGAATRYHKEFAPEGTNADFVKVKGEKSINIRTYERGVEGETLACGTGAVASAIVSAILKGVKSPVDVETKGGEVLKIYFDLKDDLAKDVYLEGNAEIIYEGKVLQ